MAADPARDDLAARLRDLLRGPHEVREVAMFGGRCFMVDERLAIGAFRGGSLLVRVADDRHDEVAARPGAAQAEMGAGRSMGVGWIEVAGDAVEADDELAAWVALALERAVGPSPPR